MSNSNNGAAAIVLFCDGFSSPAALGMASPTESAHPSLAKSLVPQRHARSSSAVETVLDGENRYVPASLYAFVLGNGRVGLRAYVYLFIDGVWVSHSAHFGLVC